jgi:hypothetical protein
MLHIWSQCYGVVGVEIAGDSLEMDEICSTRRP